MKFTAIVNQCNVRDTRISSPKILLRDIMLVVQGSDEEATEFRDHCWVDISTQLAQLIKPYQRNNNISLEVEFTANTKDYQTRGPEKQTLTKIRHITLIKAIRKHSKKAK